MALCAPVVSSDEGGIAMRKGDELIATIEAIHAAGLGAEHWPRALGAISRL
jgi:hypothetical protein